LRSPPGAGGFALIKEEQDGQASHRFILPRSEHGVNRPDQANIESRY